MRTGVLTTSFPRHPGDFAGCFVEDAVRAHADAGELVDVIAAGPWSPNGTARAPDENSHHPHDTGVDHRPDLGPAIRVLRVPAPAFPGTSPLFYGAGAPEALEGGGLGIWIQAGIFWAGLCEKVRACAPTWNRIVAHWLVPSALAARAVAPHLPLTAYAHSGDIALLERLAGGAALARSLAGGIDDLIFVSADLRDRFACLSGVAVGRVGHPGAAGCWTRGDREPGRRDHQRLAARSAFRMRTPTILSVGRLVPIKGYDILLRAVGTAAARRGVRGSDFMTVVILGDGPERPRLRNLAQRMDLDLRLPGYVPRADVTRWMLAADCYVQPSRRLATGRTEGLPTATLEALRAGLPVIASRTGGLSDLAGPGVQIVPAESVRALSLALANLA